MLIVSQWFDKLTTNGMGHLPRMEKSTTTNGVGLVSRSCWTPAGGRESRQSRTRV